MKRRYSLGSNAYSARKRHMAYKRRTARGVKILKAIRFKNVLRRGMRRFGARKAIIRDCMQAAQNLLFEKKFVVEVYNYSFDDGKINADRFKVFVPPTIGRGTEEYERLGGTVKIKYIRVRGCIWITKSWAQGAVNNADEQVYAQQDWPFGFKARLMIIKNKKYNNCNEWYRDLNETIATTAKDDVGRLLEPNTFNNRANGGRAYVADWDDNFSSLNKDIYRTCFQRFPSLQGLNTLDTEQNAIGQSVYQNQYVDLKPRRFRYHFKKILIAGKDFPSEATFQHNTNNAAQNGEWNNFPWLITVGFTNDMAPVADGSTGLGLDKKLYMRLETKIVYTDA